MIIIFLLLALVFGICLFFSLKNIKQEEGRALDALNLKLSLYKLQQGKYIETIKELTELKDKVAVEKPETVAGKVGAIAGIVNYMPMLDLFLPGMGLLTYLATMGKGAININDEEKVNENSFTYEKRLILKDLDNIISNIKVHIESLEKQIIDIQDKLK